MKMFQIAGIILIAAGAAGLAYGEFTYTKEEHRAELGPIELSIEERETVNIPRWAGLGGIAAGAALLLAGAVKH
jgi:hypothetical protein